MLSFDEALRLVLSNAVRLASERVSLASALGRVLAQPVVARAPFPAFSASAMDGYAVATTSFAGAGPWTLAVVGESRMGALPDPLRARTACRIFTGAALPAGADAVVMQEDVRRDGDQVPFATGPPGG